MTQVELGQMIVDDDGINKVIQLHDWGGYTSEQIMPKEIFIEAYKRWIAKESDTMLDKIRAEIEERVVPRSVYTDKQKKQVLEIIDKYRKEQTDADSD